MAAVDTRITIDYHPDSDGDGVALCDDTSNCDDFDYLTWPGAPGLCDGVDNDRDGVIDGNIATIVWYIDSDGDGFTEEGGDCDDTDPQVNPVKGNCPAGTQARAAASAQKESHVRCNQGSSECPRGL